MKQGLPELVVPQRRHPDQFAWDPSEWRWEAAFRCGLLFWVPVRTRLLPRTRGHAVPSDNATADSLSHLPVLPPPQPPARPFKTGLCTTELKNCEGRMWGDEKEEEEGVEDM